MKIYLSLLSLAMVLRHNGERIYCKIRVKVEERAEHGQSNTIASKVNYQRLNDVH